MVFLLSVCLAAQVGAAATPSPPPVTARADVAAHASPSDSMTALLARLDALEKQLLAQRELLARHEAEIEAQRQVIGALRQQVEDASPVRAAAAERVPAAGTLVPPAAPAAAAAMQTAAGQGGRPPELPQAFVARGDFPGSIEIPGTDTAFKIGGLARSTLIHSLSPIGVDDRFITSSIPVNSEAAGDGARTVYTAAPSRINLEVRAPTPFGGFRTFMEFDFSGSGDVARLRHAFMQAKRFLFGQTWSTFSDPEAQPTDIDFEGLNAISLFRQAQIRYTHPLRHQFDFAMSIENPAPDLTGAEGVNLTPDFVARLRWEPTSPPQLLTSVAHVQAAALVRTLRGELQGQQNTTLSTSGFGVNVSGVLIPRWDHVSRIKFATNNGWGIGRYIKDLEALGGQDAVYDPALGALRALGVASAYVGYERQWRDWLQSAFTYGVVNISNLDIQPDGALKRTQRSSVSVTWKPVSRADLVIEFLSGERVNKNGDHGSANQVQAGWKLAF